MQHYCSSSFTDSPRSNPVEVPSAGTMVGQEATRRAACRKPSSRSRKTVSRFGEESFPSSYDRAKTSPPPAEQTGKKERAVVERTRPAQDAKVKPELAYVYSPTLPAVTLRTTHAEKFGCKGSMARIRCIKEKITKKNALLSIS